MGMKLSVWARIVLIPALSMIALGAGALSGGFTAYQRVIEEHRHQVRDAVDLAIGSVAIHYNDFKAGRVSEEEAKAAAKAELESFRFDEGEAYVWVSDLAGVLVAHPIRPDQIGKSMLSLTDTRGLKVYEAFTKAARAGGDWVSYYGRRANTPPDAMDSAKLAYVGRFEPWGWAVGAGVYTDHVLLDTVHSFVVQSSYLMLPVLGVWGLSLWIAFGVARRVRDVAGATRSLSGGELDVAINGIEAEDEIGELSRALEELRQHEVAHRAAEGRAVEERANREQRAELVKFMISQFERVAEETLLELRGAAEQLHSSSGELEGVAVATSGETEKAACSADLASAEVSAVAAASEQMAAGAHEINRQAATAREVCKVAVSQAGAARETIASFAKAAERIGESVGLIGEVAKKTRMLSLNASIEAARAGEAGRGFAIVANEVKVLAEQTSEANAVVGAQAGAVREAVEAAMRSIEATEQSLRDVDATSAGVAASVEQQTAALAEIARSVVGALSGVQAVSDVLLTVKSQAATTGTAAVQTRSTAESLSKRAADFVAETERFLSGVRMSEAA